MAVQSAELAEIVNISDDAKLAEAVAKQLDFIKSLDPKDVHCMFACFIVGNPAKAHFLSLGTPEQISRMFLEHYHSTSGIIADAARAAELTPGDKH